MKQRLYYSCLFLFILCEVQASKSDHLLNRLARAVNGTSLYGTNQNWHNNKPSNNNNWPQLNNQWNYNNNSYKPNSNNHQPQNTYGYPTKQLGWNGTGTHWNSPNGGYGQVYLNNASNYPPPNTQGYNSGSNGYPAKPVGWNGGYNPDPNRYYQPSGYNGPSSQWNNPGGNYNQANINNPNSNPTQIGWTPQFNGNSNGYNNKHAIWNSTGPQRNNLGNQQYASPNDLMIHHYKRSIDHRSYNGSWHNTDPDWHSDKKPLWNGTRSHWNNTDSRYYQGRSTSFHNTSGYHRFRNRFVRSTHHDSKYSNISWYNIDPKWYNITSPAFNGTHWNKPGGHYYQWMENNRGHSRHHHKHHDQHETDSPIPQFVSPPQNIHHGPPLNNCNYPTAHLYPHHRKPSWHPGKGSNSTYPNVPGTDVGSNSTVVNGTSLGRPANGTSSNGTSARVPGADVGSDTTVTNVTTAWVPENEGSTNVTGKDLWGPEIADMDDTASNTPDPL